MTAAKNQNLIPVEAQKAGRECDSPGLCQVGDLLVKGKGRI